MIPTVADYRQAFDQARAQMYPGVDALEGALGVAVDRARLEAAARILACPVKTKPPNWQHGRVIYARLRHYIQTRPPAAPPCVLDIGTAKGFSALCARWALDDAGATAGTVVSVDVLDPQGRVRRNTVAECDGFKTLAELHEAWPEAARIQFVQATGVEWLKQHPHRIHAAFIDGKHAFDAVREEGRLLAARQVAGDLVLFDDLQVAGVAAAIGKLEVYYELDPLVLHRDRGYVMGVRR